MFKRAKSSTQLLKNGTWQHLWNVTSTFVLIKVVSKTKWMMVKQQQKKVCKKYATQIWSHSSQAFCKKSCFVSRLVQFKFSCHVVIKSSQ